MHQPHLETHPSLLVLLQVGHLLLLLVVVVAGRHRLQLQMGQLLLQLLQ
jgi:hypothetical protein